MLIYKDVMGLNLPQNGIGVQNERLKRNAERFAHLPQTIKHPLEEKYAFLQEELKRSFRYKMQYLFEIFAFKISPYESAWIIFSLIIPLLLLKRIEGAQQAIWLLPILALLFLWENQIEGNASTNAEHVLFPTEQEIVQNYLKEPLNVNILKQREQLLRGWNVYLIQNWAHEDPSDDPVIFQRQAEKGEFMFNVKRLLSTEYVPYDFRQKISFFLLSLYVAWNLFFAWLLQNEEIYARSLKTPIPVK